jgi:Fic family protein
VPETIDTAKEIVKIRYDINDIKQSQEADMQLNREKYEKLLSDALANNPIRIKVYLQVDGIKSRKEIQDLIQCPQPTTWVAMDHLEKYGVIIKLEQTKNGSLVYGKPRWAKTLRMDDYVREKFQRCASKPPKNQP